MGDPRPVTRAGSGYVLHLGKEERALVVHLLHELRALLTGDGDPAALQRLFPVVHPDDSEREAEYQRLTRNELVTSRLAGIDVVEQAFERSGRKVTFDEGQLLAFVQAVNSVRLVLGTTLALTEDDDVEPREDLQAAPEYHLYGYLSWVLDSAVQALSS